MKRKLLTIVTLTALAIGTSALANEPMKDMKGMDMKPKPSAVEHQMHEAKGTVKSVDAKAGTVTIAHEPVASMKWPAMTMTFNVKDKALLQKLATGKQVHFEFVKKDDQHLITAVR